MKFEVRAALFHPDGPPGTVNEVQLDGDGDLQVANDLLLRAVDEVQRAAAVPSTLAELVASRGTFAAVADLLDDLGVGPGQSEGMLGLVQRLSMLGNEVRQLRAASGIPDVARAEQERRIAEVTRQRDEAWAKIRAHGTVINEVRVALNAGPETFDSELGDIARGFRMDSAGRGWGEAQTALNDARLEAEALGTMVAEADGGAEPTSHDELERRIRALIAQVERFHLGLTCLGVPPGYWAAKASREEFRGLMERIADNSDAWSQLTPERLARAVHAATAVEFNASGFESTWVPWEESSAKINERRLRIGEAALAELGAETGVTVPSPTAEQLAQAIHNGRSAAGLDVMTSWENLSPKLRAQHVKAADYALRQIEDGEPRREATAEDLARAWFAAEVEGEINAGAVSTITGHGVNLPQDVERLKAELSEWHPERSKAQRQVLAVARTVLESLAVVPPQALPREEAFALAELLVSATYEQAAAEGHKPGWAPMLYPWDDMIGIAQGFWRGVAERLAPHLTEGRSVPMSLLPVTAEELGRAMYESGPHATPWAEVRRSYAEHAQRVLDSLPSFAAPKTAGVSVEELARAINESRRDANESHHVIWLTASWEHLDRSVQDFVRFIAEGVLGRLPQIARGDADSGESFVARMDAVTSELRQEIASLRQANGAVAKERDSAFDALVLTGRVLGMSFGSSTDTDAIGLLVRTAAEQRYRECRALAVANRRLAEENRQLVEAGNDANSDMHSYRGMVMFVADQLGIPADRVDDARLFGDAFREAIEWRSGGVEKLGSTLIDMRGMPGFALEGQFIAADAVSAIEYLRGRLESAESRPLVTVCAPDPADWMVKLTPVDPGATTMRMAAVRHGVMMEINGVVCKVEFHYTGSDPQRPPGGLLLPSVSPEQLGRAWFEGDLSLDIAWEDMPADVQQAYGFHAKRVIDRLTAPALTEAAGRGVDWDAVARSMRQPGTFFMRNSVGEAMRGRSFKINEDAMRAALTGETADTGRAASSVLTQLREQGERLRELEDELTRKNRVVADVAAAMGFTSASGAIEQIIISEARKIEEFRRGHRACVGAEGLERELTEQLGVALGRDGRGEPWPELLERAKLYTMRVARFTEMRRILGFSPDTHPDLVVRAVRELKSSWDSSEEQFDRLFEAFDITQDTSTDGNVASAVDVVLKKVTALKSFRDTVCLPGGAVPGARVRDVVGTLLEAAGIDVVRDVAQLDVAVQKAGDAAAILRSWPDVVSAFQKFDGDEVDEADEIAVILDGYAAKFRQAGDCVGKLNAVQRLLMAHRGDLKPSDDLCVRLDNMVKRLFAPVREMGIAVGLARHDESMSKVVFADQVLMRVRNAFMPNPEVKVNALLDQVAFRLERLAELSGDTDDREYMVVAENLPLHRYTLKYAASVVREHAAALLSGEHPHPLVMALQDSTFWAPGVTSLPSELELVPEADGGVLLRLSGNDSIADRVHVDAGEVAPVGAALLMLAAHNARVSGLSAKIAEKLPEVEKAAEAIEPGSIRVTPRVPETWCYGPNAIDRDPGKRWHIGCGGEVLTFDGVDVCGDCRFEWGPGEGEGPRVFLPPTDVSP